MAKLSEILGNSFIGLQGIQGTIGPIGNPTSIPQTSPTNIYVLEIGDIGKHVSTSFNVSIPANTFSIGDVVTIFNKSASSITVSGPSVTMYFSGSNLTGTRTLAQKGLCTVLCVGTNEFVVTGPGLS